MVLLLRSTKKICNKSRRIYIPIWCYFYSAFGVAVPEFHQFTFQYGATSTIAAISSVSATFLFTFQYGATSTIYNHIFYCTLYDLHSNMVLLLQSTHYESSSSYIYIPIWCYFYLQLWHYYSICYRFTFQYGATSTGL